MGNGEKAGSKKFVLLWSDADEAASALSGRLADLDCELRVFEVLNEAVEFLASEANHGLVEAVLLPSTRSTAQRLEFLKQFQQRAPELFLKVPVLLVADGAAQGGTVLTYDFHGEAQHSKTQS